MKKITFVLILIISFIFNAKSQGGMWLPNEISGKIEKEMKSFGLKIKAKDIYNEKNNSIKDAIVQFGRGCTGEIISDKGLLLTNHHCGYGAIQKLSTVENNLLQQGYWADSFEKELPAKGLTVTFIEKIEDVTDKVLNGVKEGISNTEFQSLVDKNIDRLKKETKADQFQTLEISPFYNGNKFYMFYKKIYKDIRLAGTAPEAIGKFGADTDNWVWPRHNADFALFRIYADKNNNPAEYSVDNVPFKPKHSLPVSIAGVREGDFTMVFGFPGRTSEYLPAIAVDMIANKIDPVTTDIRGIALGIMDKYMRKDEATRLKYASKYAYIANFWKKWIGESRGINQSGAVGKKRMYESDFLNRLDGNPVYKGKYDQVLSKMEKLYNEFIPYNVAENMIDETFASNIDLMTIMSVSARLKAVYENNGEKAFNEYKSRLLPFVQGKYSEYDHEIDKEIFAALLKNYLAKAEKRFIPESIRGLNTDEDIESFTDRIYSTGFSSFENYKKIIDSSDNKWILSVFEKDAAYNFAMEVNKMSDEKVAPFFNEIKVQLDSLQKIYMKAQMELFPEKKFFPDANSTLRITYGQVQGYSPRDAVYYKPITYVEGVMEKYKPGDYEFDLPAKYLDMMKARDFGPYADNTGSLPVCFIGTNHTTGGNSGSPALDSKGNFIGINFDRVWEGTMSDLYYDPAICRNIMVDARYILYIIEQFSGSKRLINEMKVVGK
ncbi:MAG: S46 family peptidase [Deltaproteobacteria bacterium]